MSETAERRRFARPAGPVTELSAGQPACRLNIAVIYTSIDFTLSALRKAGALANSLNASITLIVPQVVPYPLPLTCPPVPPGFNERSFRILADEGRIETSVRIYLCRDRKELLRTALNPRSLVVIGGKDRWWPTPEKRLADQLRHAEHEVVFVQS